MLAEVDHAHNSFSVTCRPIEDASHLQSTARCSALCSNVLVVLGTHMHHSQPLVPPTPLPSFQVALRGEENSLSVGTREGI